MTEMYRLPTVISAPQWRSDSKYLADHGDRERIYDIQGKAGRRGGNSSRYFSKVSAADKYGYAYGKGAADLGIEGEVTAELMEELYDNLIHPETKERLGTKKYSFPSYQERLAALLDAEPDATPERIEELTLKASKTGKKANTYVDLCWNADKDWSVTIAALRATGDNERADALWNCYLEGVKYGMEWGMKNAGISRKGRHATLPDGTTIGEYVDARDWVMTFWEHSTSRDGDPNFHVHVAILNRVLCEDGEWRALFGKAINGARPAMQAVGERYAEELAAKRLGIHFYWKDPESVCRRIVGVSDEIRDLFSSRRRAITKLAGEVIKAYEAKWGVTASRYTKRLISQDATLKTRAKKRKDVTAEQLLSEWENKLANDRAETFQSVVDAVFADVKVPPADKTLSREKMIQAALADLVDSGRTTWNRNDLIYVLRKYLPQSVDDPATYLEALADEAIATNEVVRVSAPDLVAVPDSLRRSDGGDIFHSQNPERYATATHLGREDKLERSLKEKGGIAFTVENAWQEIETEELRGDAAEAIFYFLTSGDSTLLLIGLAGAGKTTLLASLNRILERNDLPPILGLCLSKNGANVMEKAGIRKALDLGTFVEAHRAMREAKTPPHLAAVLHERYGVTKRQVIAFDESSLLPTNVMAEAAEYVKDGGGIPLFTGDPEQLESVGAGGMFGRLIELGNPQYLNTVWRFKNDWEGEASRRLRAGDAEALIEYDKRARFVGGNEDVMRTAFVDAYFADYVADEDVIAIVNDNETAAEVNSEIVQRLVELNKVEPIGLKVRDGIEIGIGSLLQARKTEAKVYKRDKDSKIANREVFEVTGKALDGGIYVRQVLGRDDYGKRCYSPERYIPAKYLTQMEHAYAVTVHAAQGRTEGRCHALITELTERRAFYVAMTRARLGNFAYVVLGEAETYMERLIGLVERQSPDLSARQQQELSWQSADHLMNHGSRFDAVAEMVNAKRYDRMLSAHLGELFGTLEGDPATPAIHKLLRSAELEGHNVYQLIERTVNERDFEDVKSVAKVLHRRLSKNLSEMSVSHETSFAWSDLLPPRAVDPGEDTDLRDYLSELVEAIETKSMSLAEIAVMNPPEYLTELIGEVPDDPLPRAEWLKSASLVEAYRERHGYERADAIGPCPGRGQPERRALWFACWEALGRPASERPMAERSVGELFRVIADYERTTEWEPDYVGAHLKTAHETAKTWREKARRERAKLESFVTEGEATGKLRDSIARAEALAADAESDIAELEEKDRIRREWMELTAGMRDERKLAQEEIGIRFPNARLAQEAAEAEAAAKLPPVPETEAPVAKTPLAALREQLIAPKPSERPVFTEVSGEREGLSR